MLRPGNVLWSWCPPGWTIQAAAVFDTKPSGDGIAARTLWPVDTLAKRIRRIEPRLAKADGAGWLTVNIYYRWLPGTNPLRATRRLSLWVNGYSAAYQQSSFYGPGGQGFVHAVSVPADRIGGDGGMFDMLLTAQIESRNADPATLIVDRIDVICAMKACRP
jgi:hypothetical protein